MLNVPFSAGKIIFVEDQKTILDLKENELEILIKNLEKLSGCDSLERFKIINALNSNNDVYDALNYGDNRWYVLSNIVSITSVVSNASWKKCDKRNALIKKLYESNLPDPKSKNFDYDDWRYYFSNYDSFRAGKYGLFTYKDYQVSESANDLCIGGIEYAKGQKLRNTWDPFVYAAYDKKIGSNNKVEDNWDDFITTSTNLGFNANTYSNIKEDVVEMIGKDYLKD